MSARRFVSEKVEARQDIEASGFCDGSLLFFLFLHWKGCVLMGGPTLSGKRALFPQFFSPFVQAAVQGTTSNRRKNGFSGSPAKLQPEKSNFFPIRPFVD